MPELDFILNEEERILVVEFAFENGCKLIPGRHYSEKKYEMCTNMEDYSRFCQNEPLLFIINKKYSIYPLEFDFFENENGKKYFIKQRCGGPTIDFYSPILGEKKDNIVGTGLLGIYTHYYHDGKKFVPNSELSNIYKELSSFIKRMSRKIELSERTFRVGKKTIEKAMQGKIKLLPISGIDLLTLV
ncbi:MAG TPA: hypothetical protein VGQ09_05070 [Chitinophagaceae bacterium]|jgi:hypothetical protein|nr:hypothetical protein [Chitinophagaceae bacterium]